MERRGVTVVKEGDQVQIPGVNHPGKWTEDKKSEEKGEDREIFTGSEEDEQE